MNASYISVPRDLTRVKSKIIFNLTKRQLICFTLAAIVSVPSFFVMKRITGNISAATLGMMVIALPFFFFSMYEKNGQTPETVLKHIYQTKIKRPGIRPYRTDNYYAALKRCADVQQEIEGIVMYSAAMREDRKNTKGGYESLDDFF